MNVNELGDARCFNIQQQHIILSVTNGFLLLQLLFFCCRKCILLSMPYVHNGVSANCRVPARLPRVCVRLYLLRIYARM